MPRNMVKQGTRKVRIGVGINWSKQDYNTLAVKTLNNKKLNIISDGYTHKKTKQQTKTKAVNIKQKPV